MDKSIKKIILSRAQSWHETSGLEKDDLIQEGWIIFFKIMKNHEQTNSKITTHLYSALNNHYYNMVRQSRRKTINSKTKTKVDPFTLYCLIELIEQLSQEAQEVVKIILDGKLSTKETNKPRHIKGLLRKHLTNMGWSWRKIQKTHNEIKESLQ